MSHAVVAIDFMLYIPESIEGGRDYTWLAKRCEESERTGELLRGPRALYLAVKTDPELYISRACAPQLGHASISPGSSGTNWATIKPF
ncbi:hypothetical protein VNO77_38868 [Canavalia gladiata]|uniref:Uncharacterized protein n=1 Tax=Canavalia gladiata TaxID=3824 RepID=A0AAN9KCB3_CANGL